MRTTIDAAGRLVIPKKLRDAVGLGEGLADVDVTVEGAGLRIEPLAGGQLVLEDGILVVAKRGPTITDETIRDLVDADRDRHGV